jgi:nucleotide-binding universal stress UspA family protein
MMQVKRILVPTDFSESSQCALRHATELARKFGAELVLTHIRTPYADDPNRPEYHFFDEGRYSAFVTEELSRTSEGISSDHVVRTLVGRDVSPANGILRVAEENQADLIVMGTHGRTGLGHFFLGSVAEKVVRHARLPVMTVSSKREGYRDNHRYQRILASYDFSAHSREAVCRARDLAALYGARLSVLYVIEQEIHPGYYDVWKVSVKSEMPGIAQEARKSLLSVLGEHGLDDVEVFVEVGRGDGRVHRDITRFAADHETDLIVMGTYGLSGIEHMLLGSTTERVIRIAPCPVLTSHLSRRSKTSGDRTSEQK